MLHIDTILHPTDLSEPAGHALQLAHSLARDHGARLVLLNVVMPPMPVTEVYVPTGELDGLMDSQRRHIAELAHSILDVPVETHVVQGVAASAIVTVAEKCQADLIVMGTHGRSGLSRMVLGSVAESVMRQAHCPVMTVKPGKTERVPVDEGFAAQRAQPAYASVS
jgi:nucleotide-binding universal stress UspA family protein